MIQVFEPPVYTYKNLRIAIDKKAPCGALILLLLSFTDYCLPRSASFRTLLDPGAPAAGHI